MTDILYRLKNPPFGVETTERHMFSAAADRIEALERENARLREALERIAAHCNLCDRYGVTENKEQLRIAKEALA